MDRLCLANIRSILPSYRAVLFFFKPISYKIIYFIFHVSVKMHFSTSKSAKSLPPCFFGGNIMNETHLHIFGLFGRKEGESSLFTIAIDALGVSF